MNSFIKNNYLNLIIAFCAVVLFSVVISFTGKNAIDGDGRDYYSYLVSLFINHNFTNQVGNEWFLIQTPTGTINVHTLGVSLLISPFFFSAFLFSKIAGFPVDGFSLPFQTAVFLAGIFYCVLGLVFLKKLLLQLNVKSNLIAFLIIITCFGTHLYNYTVNEPGMPHVYSFALTSVFLYLALNLFQKRSANYFYLSAIVLGLIILVRPINVILLTFLPFFFLNRFDMVSTIKVILKSKHFYFSIISLLLVCSLQSFSWFFQNGKIFQDSYVGNGFYFSNPEILKMLFGFNNGLFIYVPICFLFLLGVIPIFANNKYKGFVFILSMSFIIYVFASYWAYNYFDGFGIRTFVDFLPVFVIAGAGMFQYFTPRLKYIAYAFSIIFLFVNLFHIYQYQFGIIKGNGMNCSKYRYVFLKSDKAYADSLGGANDLPLYTKTEKKMVFEDNNMISNQKIDNDSVCDFQNLEYGVGYNYLIPEKANSFFIVAEFERKESFRNSSFNALISLNATDKENKHKLFQAFRLNEIPATNCCDWKKYSYSIAVSGKFEQNDKLSLFIWNREKTSFFIKNFKLKIYDYSYTI